MNRSKSASKLADLADKQAGTSKPFVPGDSVHLKSGSMRMVHAVTLERGDKS